MIIANGYIQLKYKAVGGFDENHFPIPAKVTYGNRMPCQYRFLQFNNLAESNGEAITTAKYEILVDADEYTIDSEILKLYDVNGKEIGEFSIISNATLDTVLLCRILV